MSKQTKETEGKSDDLYFICLLIISLVNFILYLDAVLYRPWEIPAHKNSIGVVEEVG